MRKNKIIAGVKRALAGIAAIALLLTSTPFPAMAAQIQGTEPWLLSKGRYVYSSSENGSGELTVYANDGKMTTKWQAAAGIGNQWLVMDLGASADLSQIVINWQGRNDAPSDLEVLVSDDEITWKQLYRNRENTNASEEVKVYKKNSTTVDYTYYKQTLDVEGTGRYVKIYGRKSGSSYGMAIRELEVYGVGGVTKPEPERTNLALDKETTASSYVNTWNTDRVASYATDGVYNEFWRSASTNDEWLQVDLGDTYKVGKMAMQWQDVYGRIFEIQTSTDGEHWTPIFREVQGIGADVEFNCYQDARYVRMQGYAMRDNGYSIRELEVYEYVEGDPKENPEMPDMPEKEVVNVGEGSYLIDQTLPQPREPIFLTKAFKETDGPVPSNDWWTSIVWEQYSHNLIALPLVYNYTSAGLNMFCADKVYTNSTSGGMYGDFKFNDLTVGTSSIVDKPSAKLDDYGDWSVDVVFSDDDTPKMRSTLIKGSPFVYNTFADPSSAKLTVTNLVKFYDDAGNEILQNDGDVLITDHIGVENTNKSKSSGSDANVTHYYGVFAPKGTRFTRSGDTIKIQLGSNQDYLNIGVMKSREDLLYTYQYAYAVVTNTKVSYDYNEKTADITTTYKNILQMKRTESGFKQETLMCLFPHQWKNYSGDNLTKKSFTSIRGQLKVLEGTGFTYGVKFNGIVPGFTEPVESEYYDKELLEEYIEIFKKSGVMNAYWTADPYWQGKKTHMLTMSIMIAQELGDYEMRDECVAILRKILENWLTYSGDEDTPYYMYYHPSWGAMSGDGGDHGMARNLSDHHFLWAYYIYPAAILASYDPTFVEDYGDMLEMLIRDTMNPDKEDEMFPFMRNFDPYEGHSWAGGYADNNSGNNQESASEAIFAWSGLYLWGLVTGQDEYRDAGIWGYTTEANAIEQYWFDIDGDNWDSDYIHGDIGMIYGLSYNYGTYFSGNPCCIYGIHWLPVTPSLCFFGQNTEKAAQIWENYTRDQEYYQSNLRDDQNDPEGWKHITWPFMSQSNPEGAAELWKAQEDAEHAYAAADAATKKEMEENEPLLATRLTTDEKLNAYWFIQNMCAKGTPSDDIWSSNYTSYEVFKKGDDYTATVWNPFPYEIKVEFADETGAIGYTRVAPNATVSVNPYEETDYTDVEIPEVEDTNSVHTVPGVIEAEEYYTTFGASIENNYLAYIDNGEHVEYDVNVEEEGDYIVEFNVKGGSTDKPGRAVVLQSSNEPGVDLTTAAFDVNSSWHIETGDKTVHLKAGRQKLSVVFKAGGFHFDYFRIYKEGTTPPSTGNEDPTKADLTGMELLSQGKTATASSQNGGAAPGRVTDGQFNTNWESTQKVDPQWIQIDLESSQKIGGVKLYWQSNGAAAKDYTIEISEKENPDPENPDDWKVIFTRTNGTGGNGFGDENRSNNLESIKFDAVYNARHIRMYGTARTGGYGYNMYEFQVYGKAADQKEVLEAPALNAVKQGDDVVALSWNTISGAKEYNIYRKEANDADAKLLKTVATTSYQDTDIPNGTYSYWVTAIPSGEGYMESGYSADVAAITINASFPVEKVELDQHSVEIKAGEDVTLTAALTPAKATDKTIQWVSSDRDIASVRNGVVHGVAEGTVTITVQAADNKTDSCTVVVKPADKPIEEPDDEPQITIDPNAGAGDTEDPGTVPDTNTLGIPQQLTFTVDNSGSHISWAEVEGAEGYNVYRADTRYGTYSKINSTLVTDTKYTDPENKYYKVTAVVSGKESEMSKAVSEDIMLFGENVYIFDPNDNEADAQDVIYDIYDKQEAAQFGSGRYALLFKPGTYENIKVDVGFYTQVAGLGLNPTDTKINNLRCGAWWMPMENGHVGFNATCNFWRSAENLEVNSDVMWAVSQAVSLRRMQINGNLTLHHNGGWSSGGFLADSVITGTTSSGSQQQWLSRNTSWSRWDGANWNMVFVGIAEGKAPTGTWPEKAYTTVEKTPEVREKPYLTIDENGEYSVFVPSLQTDAVGTSWTDEDGTPGKEISLDDFYVAKADTDTAETMNAALKAGKNLLLTPGIYKIDQALEVEKANTVVLGLGLATLESTNGNDCVHIADVDGVALAGVLMDAGETSSETLVQVGTEKSSVSHEANPITLSDVYFRVGGSHVGKAETSLEINSNNVIGDNLWVWRADHGEGAKWNQNVTKNGVVVNGDDVTMYALMVEHYHEYQTLWNGERGKVYFYQSEIPYDVPSQSEWMSNDGTIEGYASYKVADDVQEHEAWGLGIYSFHRDADVNLFRAMEVPERGTVKIHNACSVKLAGNGGITHVVNNCGDAVTTAGQRAIVTEYAGNVLQPVITPGTGFYNTDKEVTITTAAEGAEIYYTTDGTDPSRTNGTRYTEPFEVTTGVTQIKAIAVKEGQTDSFITTAEITIGNVLYGKTATASSEQGNDKAARAIDADPKTRWQSVSKVDPQWIQIDLGKEYVLESFSIQWETAAAKKYQIQVSSDGENWTDVYVVTDGKAGAKITGQAFDEKVNAKYVRIYGTERTGTNYGYSIYEFSVYGTAADGKELPDAPVWVKEMTHTENSIALEWESVGNANEYIVYRAINTGGFRKIATTTETTYTDASLKNELYTYKIAAKNELGESDKSGQQVQLDLRDKSTETDPGDGDDDNTGGDTGDTTALQVAVNMLNATIADADTLKEADYTAESWAPFAEALANAKEISVNTNATIAEVNSARTSLEAAKNKLQKLDSGDGEDKALTQARAELNDIILQAGVLEEELYTVESWAPFAEALAEAKKVSGMDEATLEAIKGATEALQTAQQGLKLITSDNNNGNNEQNNNNGNEQNGNNSNGQNGNSSNGQNSNNSNEQNSNNGNGQNNDVPVVTPTVKWNVNYKTVPLQLKNKKKVNKTTALQPTGLQPGDSVKSYTSSNTKIATVVKNSKGELTITPKKVGKTTLTVTTAYGATAKINLKVQKAAVRVSKLTVDNVKKKKLTLQKGESFTLETTKKYITALDKVIYTSDNPGVAKVTSKGKITAKKKGKAKITVKCQKKKVVIKVTVK